MFNVLIIDDNENFLFLIKEILEKENFNTFTAKNGKEALKTLDYQQIDAIVVDIMMPEMDGYDFTKELRQSNMELPLFMISAKQLPEDRKKAFRLGVDDFMCKPIDQEEFVLRLKALLRRSKIVAEKKIVIGDVVIDYPSLSVVKNGTSVTLPQKEFMLLFKLLSYPNKIFTRIQLMDEVWGMNCDTGWETVTVHINRLRKRFEDYDEFEIISVRGLGYKAVKKV